MRGVLVVEDDHDDGRALGRLFRDEREGPVLHGAATEGLGVDVGALLDLERALARDGLRVALAQDEEVVGVLQFLRQARALRVEAQSHAEGNGQSLQRLHQMLEPEDARETYSGDTRLSLSLSLSLACVPYSRSLVGEKRTLVNQTWRSISARPRPLRRPETRAADGTST